MLPAVAVRAQAEAAGRTGSWSCWRATGVSGGLCGGSGADELTAEVGSEVVRCGVILL